jgi:hypothetical protein
MSSMSKDYLIFFVYKMDLIVKMYIRFKLTHNEQSVHC